MPARRLRILMLEPHDGGSHRAVARGLLRHSRHRLTLDTLPARNWKWRLRAAAMVFARRHAEDIGRYDLVLASSLQNLSDFASFLRARAPLPPLVLYMHESQVAYPPALRPPKGGRPEVTPAAGGAPRDWGLLFADLCSARAADAVLFNSRHHRDAFLAGVRELIAALPDAAPRGLAGEIRRRCRVLPPGVEMADIPAPGSPGWRRARSGRAGGEGPLILWNHRWEFDKRPGEFFAALRALEERGASYRLALLGESARIVPKPFLQARERFAHRLVRYGRAGSRSLYARWLARADILVSTSEHENFGISWLEAMAAGAWPLLPRREAYPELLPRAMHADHLYEDREDLVRRLAVLCASPEAIETGRARRAARARRFSWQRRIDAFDEAFRAIASRRRSRRAPQRARGSS